MEWSQGCLGLSMGQMGEDRQAKITRGWGLKNIYLFARALVAKGGWHLIHSENLWTRVMIEKYIAPDSVVD